MKRVFLLVLVSAMLGWFMGELLNAEPAENVLHTAMANAGEATGQGAAHHAGNGTIELAARDSEESSQLPQDILDARARGAVARQLAIQRAIGKVFPKSGTWGMGGPLFPMGQAIVPVPHHRPIHTAFLVPLPNPYGGPTPPGDWPFGPGDPHVPPHITHIEDFPPPSPVPEPAAWLLMIAGFAGLGWRLQMASRRTGAPKLT